MLQPRAYTGIALALAVYLDQETRLTPYTTPPPPLDTPGYEPYITTIAPAEPAHEARPNGEGGQRWHQTRGATHVEKQQSLCGSKQKRGRGTTSAWSAGGPHPRT